MDLLLIADEQENMIDRYLEKGDMFALYGEDLKSICVVTCEENGIYEIKNIATYEEYRGNGYARYLIDFIANYYKDCRTILVGTGESSFTVPFYKRCGFKESHKIKNFFTDNYDHPIIEGGVLLKDMLYLKKEVNRG